MMWRSSAKRAGAATAGVILALSSWRTRFGSERRHDQENSNNRFEQPHLAKCTKQQSEHNEAVPVPDVIVDLSPISLNETSSSTSSAESGASALFSSTQIKNAIARSRRLVNRAMLERGIPGGVVAVMKDGVLVWSEGIGYADVENAIPCRPNTPMRIASISKPLTAVALLQLWQKGLVDLDAPVQKYVPEFPEKEYKGEKVVVTTRQLLSHMAGIRHYTKVPPQNEADSSADTSAIKEFEQEEYYINTHFDSVLDSVKLFADDELLSKPGAEFNYTTHGWTLISAVLEKVSDKPFLQYMADHVFRPLGMSATKGEFHQELVYNRARYYVRRDGGLLQNTPYVDISYKWAGGGLISTAHDLTKFGNALLACYQFHAPNSTATQCGHNNDFILTKEGQFHQMTQSTASLDTPNLNCILDPDTISMMWTPVVFPYKTKADTGYGMGWVVRNGSARTVGGRGRPFYAAHSGGAVGASSILIIMPADTPSPNNDNSITKTRTRFVEHDVEFDCEGRCKCINLSKMVPKGVVVAVLFNLQEVSNITSLGVQIAEEFLQIQSNPQNVIRFCHNTNE